MDGDFPKTSIPTEVLKETRILPDFARLVVMMIAPLEALKPYNAVADGPFKTEIFSISSGLMSAARLVFANCSEAPGELDPALGKGFPPLVPLEIMIPSITNNG